MFFVATPLDADYPMGLIENQMSRSWVYVTGVCMWLDARSRGTRGQVVCQVPSSATHVCYVGFSPDDQLIALSANKLIYIIDIKVCIKDCNFKALREIT